MLHHAIGSTSNVTNETQEGEEELLDLEGMGKVWEGWVVDVEVVGNGGIGGARGNGEEST